MNRAICGFGVLNLLTPHLSLTSLQPNLVGRCSFRLSHVAIDEHLFTYSFIRRMSQTFGVANEVLRLLYLL